MKYFLIVGLYPNEICPAFTLSLAKALKSMGHVVFAILPDNVENIDDWKKIIDDNKLCFIHIEKKNFYDKYINIFSFIFFSKRILKDIYNVKFDCVFFTFFHRWNSLILKKVKSNFNVSFLHDPKMHSGENARRENHLVRQMKKMDKLIVLSRSFIPYTIKTYDKKSSDVVYMPLCLFYGTRSLESVNEYIDSNKPINFLFFGRICQYKGIHVLISAFKLLEKYDNFSCLTIVGNGDFSEYEDEYKTIKNAKLLNRYIRDEEIEGFFKQVNTVVVVPYTDATQSGVISLAYSFGNPVIASDTGGLREQLASGNVGVFFETGNVNQLFICMKKFSSDRQYLKSEVKKMIGYSFQYDWNKATKDLLVDLNI